MTAKPTRSSCNIAKRDDTQEALQRERNTGNPPWIAPRSSCGSWSLRTCVVSSHSIWSLSSAISTPNAWILARAACSCFVLCPGTVSTVYSVSKSLHVSTLYSTLQFLTPSHDSHGGKGCYLRTCLLGLLNSVFTRRKCIAEAGHMIDDIGMGHGISYQIIIIIYISYKSWIMNQSIMNHESESGWVNQQISSFAGCPSNFLRLQAPWQVFATPSRWISKKSWQRESRTWVCRWPETSLPPCWGTLPAQAGPWLDSCKTNHTSRRKKNAQVKPSKSLTLSFSLEPPMPASDKVCLTRSV